VIASGGKRDVKKKSEFIQKRLTEGDDIPFGWARVDLTSKTTYGGKEGIKGGKLKRPSF